MAGLLGCQLRDATNQTQPLLRQRVFRMRSPGVPPRAELFSIGILFSNKQYNDRMSAKKSVNLEKSLADLESIVEELESGDLPLEKAMKKFEEGIKLTRNCQSALKEAEQKVEILLESAGGEELEEFDVDDED